MFDLRQQEPLVGKLYRTVSNEDTGIPRGPASIGSLPRHDRGAATAVNELIQEYLRELGQDGRRELAARPQNAATMGPDDFLLFVDGRDMLGFKVSESLGADRASLSLRVGSRILLRLGSVDRELGAYEVGWSTASPCTVRDTVDMCLIETEWAGRLDSHG